MCRAYNTEITGRIVPLNLIYRSPAGRRFDRCGTGTVERFVPVRTKNVEIY